MFVQFCFASKKSNVSSSMFLRMNYHVIGTCDAAKSLDVYMNHFNAARVSDPFALLPQPHPEDKHSWQQVKRSVDFQFRFVTFCALF